jgi:hypothetical protein
MASTPLYRKLKNNGTTFYAFPGASEDISSSYQNDSYKMYFSKYVLLNLPKQNLNPGSGTQSKNVYFDFDNSFNKSVNATPALEFQDQFVESLRNYVANHEIVLRESRLNNTNYYYDTNALETTSEKIFWKWCKKLNIIDFEPAVAGDQYFENLPEFESRNINDDEFFSEILWREREVIDYPTISFYQTGGPSGNLEIEFPGDTNFRVGDIINIYDVSDQVVTSIYPGIETLDGINVVINQIIPSGGTQGQRVIVDLTYTGTTVTETTGQARLVYHKLVQYIGEVNGVSNVNEANRSYTEVFANIPDHTGMTPDVLFRTKIDPNYRPNLTFPIIPSQIQPEILGAENFNSPIVNTPQNYPGSYFGQFDTLDFTYKIETGDDLRRSGRYFGISSDINNPTFTPDTIDGLTINFNRNHYVKMNIPNRIVTNFDQFNALNVNNEPPKDFEFNAILWYYTVEDNNGNERTNLYGITFLDNPNNSVNPQDFDLNGFGLKFPTIKKLVANGQQDGTAYQFGLNLNFNIINDNTVDAYNPQAINSLFSMNLFNEAMSRLSSTNDSFLNIIAEQDFVRSEIRDIKGLLYTQTDFNTINTRIRNLEDLLRLYSTMQLTSSESIEVNTLPGTPPLLQLKNKDTNYTRVDNLLTTELYSPEGIIPISLSVPENKNFLVNITNNDEIPLDLGTDKLTLILDRDLDIRQSVDILIDGSEQSTQNKKLDIFMVSNISDNDSDDLSEVLILGDIDLPVFFNENYNLVNTAFKWKEFKFNIDFDQPIQLITDNELSLSFENNPQIIFNSIKDGDTLYLNNFFLGTGSVVTDFSGQYKVQSVGSTNSTISLDISNNIDLVSSYLTQTKPYNLHTQTQSSLFNLPYFSLNKGKKVKLTRVNNSNIITERYKIEINDLK